MRLHAESMRAYCATHRGDGGRWRNNGKIPFAQLVRKNWKDLYEEGLLTHEEKIDAKKAFKAIHQKSVSDQKEFKATKWTNSVVRCFSA